LIRIGWKVVVGAQSECCSLQPEEQQQQQEVTAVFKQSPGDLCRKLVMAFLSFRAPHFWQLKLEGVVGDAGKFSRRRAKKTRARVAHFDTPTSLWLATPVLQTILLSASISHTQWTQYSV
jgi:hypothetical protein